MKNIVLFLFLFSCPVTGFMQIIENSNFLAREVSFPLNLNEPAEGNFKVLKSLSNSVQPCDFGYRLKKGDLEIRFLLDPIESTPDEHFAPHINFLTKAMHVASNEGEQLLVVHEVKDQDLEQSFHADWGGQVFFEPKLAFSEKAHCKMVALFSEGVGMVYVFYLFDKPSIEVDNYFYCVSF